MGSGERRPSRGRSAAEDPAQASLDGLLPPDAPDEAPTAGSRAEAPRRASRRASRVSGNAAEASGNDAEALRDSLDRLEQNVTLLLARHGEILAARADADKRRAQGKLDPLELQDRVRALEAERERLDHHAAFLEDRIRGLLSRVRYVVES